MEGRGSLKHKLWLAKAFSEPKANESRKGGDFIPFFFILLYEFFERKKRGDLFFLYINLKSPPQRYMFRFVVSFINLKMLIYHPIAITSIIIPFTLGPVLCDGACLFDRGPFF